MANPPMYEGQIFDAPGKPSLVWHKKTGFTPLDANGNSTIGAPVPPAIVATNAKRVSDMGTEADTMGTLSAQAHDSMTHNQNTGSGGILGMPVIGGPLAHIAEAFNPDLKAMDTNAVLMAKNMRAVGQRLTQMEWQKNLGAVPSPSNSPAANQQITNGIDRARTAAAAQASFYSSYLKHTGGDLSGADAAWLKFKTQHFDGQGNYSHTPLNASAPAADPALAGWSIVPGSQ